MNSTLKVVLFSLLHGSECGLQKPAELKVRTRFFVWKILVLTAGRLAQLAYYIIKSHGVHVVPELDKGEKTFNSDAFKFLILDTQLSPMAILTFPMDILVEIFSEVPHITDLLACARVCKTFHQTFKYSTRLEYRIELERAGMINNTHCNLPTSMRLKMLRERERAWGHFDWGQIISDIQVPFPSSSLCGVTSTAVMWGLLDTDTPGECINTRGFQSAQLSSTGGRDNSAVWNMANVGEDVLDFEAAIEENDLLVYVTK